MAKVLPIDGVTLLAGEKTLQGPDETNQKQSGIQCEEKKLPRRPDPPHFQVCKIRQNKKNRDEIFWKEQAQRDEGVEALCEVVRKVGRIRNPSQLEPPFPHKRAERLGELVMFFEQVQASRLLRLVVQVNDLRWCNEHLAVFTQTQAQIHVLAGEAERLSIVASNFSEHIRADEVEFSADALFERSGPASHQCLSPEIIAVPIILGKGNG